VNARLALLAGMFGAALAVLAAPAGEAAGLRSSAIFNATAWPFLLDQWGTGRAFRCEGCGGELALYVRAKVGFCNCATGVTDDLEIDRVADFDLFPGHVTPIAPGQPVTVAWMRGRARAFAVDGSGGTRRYLVTVALSNKCDGVIATLASNEPINPDFMQAALEDLASPPVLGFVEATTGLQ
jgi:hypothetical protein